MLVLSIPLPEPPKGRGTLGHRATLRRILFSFFSCIIGPSTTTFDIKLCSSKKLVTWYSFNHLLPRFPGIEIQLTLGGLHSVVFTVLSETVDNNFGPCSWCSSDQSGRVWMDDSDLIPLIRAQLARAGLKWLRTRNEDAYCGSPSMRGMQEMWLKRFPYLALLFTFSL